MSVKPKRLTSMDDLQQYWAIFKRRWLPITVIFSAVLAVSAIRTPQEKPIYQAVGLIQLRKSTASLIGLGGQLTQGTTSLKNEAAILRSEFFAQKTIQNLSLKETPNEFLTNLNVVNVEGTDLLRISYRDPDREKSQQIVNTVMELYIENDVGFARAETKAAREFIDQELPKAEANLRQVDEAMRRLKEQNDFLDLGSEASSTSQALRNLDQKIAETQSQLAIENNQVASLQELFGVNSEEITLQGIVGESPIVTPMLEQLRDLQLKIESEKLRFSESHPVIVTLRKQEAILKAELDQRIQQSFVGEAGRLNTIQDPNKIIQPGGLQQSLINNYVRSETQRDNLERQLAMLSESENYHSQRALIIPQLEQRQRELERQQQVAQQIYQNLLVKRQDLLVAENQQMGNARILSEALVPNEPILRPWYSRYMQGAITALIMAGAAAWLLETIDKTIKTSESAREILDYPLLGTIPDFGERSQALVVRDLPVSFVSEAFRMVLTNLKFLRGENSHHVLVVASSVPREGKSTIAANLAIATAQMGRRVLLIDADLRKSTQHRLWKLPNQVGLSGVLMGQTTLTHAVVEVMPHLDVLVGGDSPPNPVALFDSGQMTALIEQYSPAYDLVLIDTPPLTLAADATILGRIADGILLVVRPGVADSQSVGMTKELLEQSNQTVLGLVINGMQIAAQYYYRNGYGPVADSNTESLPPVGG